MLRGKKLTPSEKPARDTQVVTRDGEAATVPGVPDALLTTYRVEEPLGFGAMGVVYRATHLGLARSVAIKLPTVAGAEFIERFVREGRVMASLQHPNLVRVFDAGQAGGRPYLVLEYVRGCTLSTLACDRRLPVAVAVALVVQLLDGLGHAHSHGVLHRDVKSANALVTEDGVLKLADFGLARSDLDAGLTRAGMIMGSPAYMSPEQARGEIVNIQSDLYSAAVVLFELVTGRQPFQSESTLDLLAMQISDPAPSLRDFVREVPEALAEAVARGLAKAPGERFATAEEFAARLRGALGERAVEEGAAHLSALVAGVGSDRQVVAGTTFLNIEARTGHCASFAPPAHQSSTLQYAEFGHEAQAPRGGRRTSDRTTTVSRRSCRVDAAIISRLRTPIWRSAALLGAVLAGVAAAWLWLPRHPSDPGAVPTNGRPASSSVVVAAAKPALGAIQIGSRPPGARVIGKGGSDTGLVTPARIERLSPGKWEFVLELAGYGRGTVTVQVVAGETQKVNAVLKQRLLPLNKNEFGYEEFRNPKDGSVLIAIPGGTFQMGSNDGDLDEKPVHGVCLSSYYIGKYEVTWKQYLAFCAVTHRSVPERPAFAGDEHPAMNVTWTDAKAYCDWAGLALPTEAQWEFAARGKAGRKYPWGPQAPDAGGVYRANWGEGPDHEVWRRDGFEYTAPVGSYGPRVRPPRADGSSPVGALDMAGNVWEWCSDWYGSKYYRASPAREPVGPTLPSKGVFDAGRRVLRGGSWFLLPELSRDLRASARYGGEPTDSHNNNGFRAARSFP